jgi:hypothetical protein
MSLMLLKEILRRNEVWFTAQDAAHSTLTQLRTVLTVVYHYPALKTNPTVGMKHEGTMRNNTVTAGEETV